MVDVYNNEEYWRTVHGYPRHRVSSYGRVQRIDTGEDVPFKRNRAGDITVTLDYYTDTYVGPVWLLMARNFFKVDYWRIDVSYRDQNPANLNMFNLLFYDKVNSVPIIFRLQPDGLWVRVRSNSRPVRIVETNEIFDSVRECAEYIGGDPRLIYSCLRGNAKTHRGYTFEWI